MEHEQLLALVKDVVSEFGTPVYLDRGQVGENSRTYATIETLINVRSDDQGTTLLQDLKAKIAEYVELLRTEGATRSIDGAVQRLTLVTQAPKFTYRDPSVNEIPNGVLYSVSIGFPAYVAD